MPVAKGNLTIAKGILTVQTVKIPPYNKRTTKENNNGDVVSGVYVELVNASVKVGANAS